MKSVTLKKGGSGTSPTTSSLIAQAGPADQYGAWSAGGLDTAISAWGLFDPYTSSDNGSAFLDDATGHGITQSTSAVLGNRATLNRLPIDYTSDLKFIYTYKFALGNITDIRFWTGLSTTTNAMIDADSDNNTVGIQYSTNRPDTNFQFLSEGTTQTLVDSGVAADTDPHIFEMIYTPGVSVNFKLWNSTHTTLEADQTITTNLVAASTGLEITAGISTLAAAVKSITQYKGELLITPQS
jgi:hypothetical protein